MSRGNRYSYGMGMNGMEMGVMNDRGSYMFGKVFLSVVLIVGILSGALMWQLAKHEIAKAEAEQQRVLNAAMQAELEARIPYMDAIEAEETRQLIARMQSDGLTAGVMAELNRRQLLHEQDMREAADREGLSFTARLHDVAVTLAYVAGLALITIPSGLVGFVLFKKVGMKMDALEAALAVQLEEARAALSAQPAAPQPRPAPAPGAPPAPAPVALPTGRLDDLPQGQPVRERRSQPGYSQPATERSAPVRHWPSPQDAGGYVIYSSNGNSAAPNGNGVYSNGYVASNGNGTSANGATLTDRNRRR